jgi:hypothetical protein
LPFAPATPDLLSKLDSTSPREAHCTSQSGRKKRKSFRVCFCVTLFALGFRLFLIQLQINTRFRVCHAGRLLPPRTLVMDVTMTHDRYGRTTQRTNGALTHRVSSTGAPQVDGVLNNTSRIKIRHYRQTQ